MSETTEVRFDASLPSPYTKEWRKAYRAEPADSPRLASYQAPGGQAVFFIQRSFRFSGGHSSDTAEYPFGGLWSNEYLNEKPQSFTVEGFLRGTSYIAERNALIEALRIPTDDDNPGYIDLPFWGRFPVVVSDTYEVSENTDEQGQCSLSITFTRAGVSIEKRMDELALSHVDIESAQDDLQAAAVNDFEAKLKSSRIDIATLRAGFGEIKKSLLSITSRIQGVKTTINTMTAEVSGILSIINQGILSPRELAQSLVNAVNTIACGIIEIKNSAASYGKRSPSSPFLPFSNNSRSSLVMFLSSGSFSLPVTTATVNQEIAKRASENLYRTVAFSASAAIMADSDSLTQKNASGYWRLLQQLEESIDRDNPEVHSALANVRIALSNKLSLQKLKPEMTRNFSVALPLLSAAHYVGCDETKIRELNSIDDSFMLEGNVIYV